VEIVNPDDEKSFKNFLQDWYSHYTARNPLEPPTITTMRILYQYVEDGSIPGDYVYSVLINALYEAFSAAPLDEVHNVNGTVQYILTYCPTECYGSPEKVTRWIERKKRKKVNVPTERY